MNFHESESYLLSLGNEVSAMKLGLENIHSLLAALGNPQNNYLKVQVAGTNGKGSVCAFLGSICLSAGVKTGVFTSPHLVSVTERIRINGSDITEDDFARHASTVRETAERLLAAGKLEYRPTFFEQVTAIALVAFADAGVELAILETGLGGRLDATTAANAEIAAITRIDYDHQEYLGETLAEIAAEKAAIIRPGTRAVVIGPQTPEAMSVIEDRCRSVQGGNPTGREGASLLDVISTANSLPLVFPPKRLGLPGRHQIENAKVAILLAEALQDHFPITTANILEGLENARHPGRLEYQGKFLFDGAHNPAGARALRAYLDEFVTQPITLIFAAMKEKDVAEIAGLLFPKAERLILTRPDNSRALTAEQLAGFVPPGFGPERVTLTSGVAEAISAARNASADDAIILVTGSLYLVGEAKKILNN